MYIRIVVHTCIINISTQTLGMVTLLDRICIIDPTKKLKEQSNSESSQEF